MKDCKGETYLNILSDVKNGKVLIVLLTIINSCFHKYFQKSIFILL